MKKTIIYFTVIICFLIYSCSKETAQAKTISDNLSKLLELSSHQAQNYDGFIRIEANAANHGANRDPIYNLITMFNNSFTIEGNKRIWIGEKSFEFKGNNSLMSQDTIYKDFFSKNLPFKIGNDIESRDIANFYLPQELFISFDETESLEITKTSNITWNEDLANDKGLHFIIEYHPHENPTLSDAYPDKITNYISTVDDGNYKLQESDFYSFPSHALIRIRVIRANYDVINFDNNEVAIFGGANNTGYLRLK